MIAVVDYGLGNVQALLNIYSRLNIAARRVQSEEELSAADRIILPGVGAFDWAMTLLERSGLRPALERLVLKEGRPVLGICVGMQMFAQQSAEGRLPGLGWIPGRVCRFNDRSPTGPTALPHMGWNDVAPMEDEGLFRGLGLQSRFYFLHSYYYIPDSLANTLAVTDYNGAYASGIRAGHIYGVQFHPEKSHQWGIRLLRNFAEL